MFTSTQDTVIFLRSFRGKPSIIFYKVFERGVLSNIPDLDTTPVIIPRGLQLVKTSFSSRLAHVSDINYVIFNSSPGANNDTATVLIEPALTPVTTS